MIDASLGFIKDGPKNRLREQDIHKIVDVFTRRRGSPRYSRRSASTTSRITISTCPHPVHRHPDAGRPAGHRWTSHGGIPVADVDALVGLLVGLSWDRQPYSSLTGRASRSRCGRKSAIKTQSTSIRSSSKFIASMNDHFAPWRDKKPPRSGAGGRLASQGGPRGCGRGPAGPLLRHAVDRSV